MEARVNSKSFKMRLYYWLPVLLWMAVIFLFSSQPYSGDVTRRFLGEFNLPVRKLAHASEYAVLFFLANRAIQATGGKFARQANWLALSLCFFYALSDEWHQSFVPGRSASLFDALIDTLGASFAFSIDGIRRLISPTS
jgi:VanZ family protein